MPAPRGNMHALKHGRNSPRVRKLVDALLADPDIRRHAVALAAPKHVKGSMPKHPPEITKQTQADQIRILRRVLVEKINKTAKNHLNVAPKPAVSPPDDRHPEGSGAEPTGGGAQGISTPSGRPIASYDKPIRYALAWNLMMLIAHAELPAPDPPEDEPW